ncbi:hypothetical protein B0T24DRAFT_96064 [Lasiosphaeria ovina]|uniref:Uncharacterized protein n=1 Tax=Lasiosphaeria ovina TaxID=92902 RepID=A0AAE0JTX5_9PEZI|nr:hypothetical protein B0T24DRAFT_96064 [Lasiosphaeria ovina]
MEAIPMPTIFCIYFLFNSSLLVLALRWEFDVPGGGRVTGHIPAWQPASRRLDTREWKKTDRNGLDSTRLRSGRDKRTSLEDISFLVFAFGPVLLLYGAHSV